jgi:hypothetical protein
MKLKSVNPLPSFLKKRMIFIVWLKYSELISKKKKFFGDLDLKLDADSSFDDSKMLLFESHQVIENTKLIPSSFTNHEVLPNSIDNNE